MNEQPVYLIDEELEPGLRYTEHMMPTGHGDAGVCSLFRTGEEKPVSELKLFKRVLAGVGERVCAAFLFGVENLYPKFGFTACLPEAKMTVWVQRLLETGLDTDWRLEPYGESHVPEIISLYNAETALRPWSRVRSESDRPRLVHGETWRPGAGSS